MALPAKRKAPKNVTIRRDGIARAVKELRRGRPVAIAGADRVVLLALAVETATDRAIVNLEKRAKAPSRLLLSHARARTLKIRLYTPDVVALLPPSRKADALRAIADPTADLATPLKGPFEALRAPLPDSAAPAIRLAKLAGLLPAMLVKRATSVPAGLATIAASEIASYEDESARTLAIVTRARVPLEGAEQTELVAFRADDGSPENYAIVVGAPPRDKPVLARLHSECFTGDLLGSLKCDCGPQLRGAIEAIAKAGGGILLYLAQEGRGIGLINKLRAYRLQDQGFDTLQANERLGFEADERLYGVAAKMLKLLGYKAVRLMTNNPDKVAALQAEGIDVVRRVPHKFGANAHNRFYLATKAKAGHLL
jgi:GTP cyclohydrolase II